MINYIQITNFLNTISISHVIDYSQIKNYSDELA